MRTELKATLPFEDDKYTWFIESIRVILDRQIHKPIKRVILSQRNRGKLSNDDRDFSLKSRAILKNAVDDLCFLLTRGYAEYSAIQIVGNRYKLNKRQRNAAVRLSCNHKHSELRKSAETKPAQLIGKKVEIDGFNVLILLENVLSGAYIFKCRDGIYRDISSVHGTYKRVMKTEEAILLVGDVLKKIGVKNTKWFLDQPVSNSGRLKSRLLELSEQHNFNWEVELLFNPDKALASSPNTVITSDGWILNESKSWFNFGSYVFDHGLLTTENLIEV